MLSRGMRSSRWGSGVREVRWKVPGVRRDGMVLSYGRQTGPPVGIEACCERA